MICSKCGLSIEQKEFTDLYRIEEHHLHPTYMNNPKGKGKLIPLCRKHHIEDLHKLILKIIISHSNLLSKRNKSEQWIWKYHVLGNNRERCIEEVIEKTLEWLEEGENDRLKKEKQNENPNP